MRLLRGFYLGMRFGFFLWHLLFFSLQFGIIQIGIIVWGVSIHWNIHWHLVLLLLFLSFFLFSSFSLQLSLLSQSSELFLIHFLKPLKFLNFLHSFIQQLSFLNNFIPLVLKSFILLNHAFPFFLKLLVFLS